MTKLISVSELVDSAAPPSANDRATWLRRARLWSAADILPTATAQRSAGKHRSYSEGTIFLGAVLFRIADFGITTNILREVSVMLQQLDEDRTRLGELWRRIQQTRQVKRRRSRYRDVYITITFQPLEDHNMLIYLTEFGPAPIINDAPAICLNLTKVSDELLAAAEGDT